MGPLDIEERELVVPSFPGDQSPKTSLEERIGRKEGLGPCWVSLLQLLPDGRQPFGPFRDRKLENPPQIESSWTAFWADPSGTASMQLAEWDAGSSFPFSFFSAYHS